jgi:hypothetical protein
VESFCLFELGLSRKQLNECTVRDYQLLSEGYKRKTSSTSELITSLVEFYNRESWRQARLIAYMQSDGKKSIWEFYPLKGDPTKKEIEEAMQKQSDEDWEAVRSLINAVQSKGIKV